MVQVTDFEIIIATSRLKLQLKTALWLPATKKKFTQLLGMMEEYAGSSNLYEQLQRLELQIDKMITSLIAVNGDPTIIKKLGSRKDQLYNFAEQWRLFNGA